jgi:hypothetical protein
VSQSSQTSAAPTPPPAPADRPAPKRGVRRTGATDWRPPQPPLSLPPEVLEAPVATPDAGWVFIDRMEEWRRAMAWEHKEFAKRLGISEPYWRAMRAHKKELTIGVAQRVLVDRPELALILGDPARYFWERSRRRKPRSRREGTPAEAG